MTNDTKTAFIVEDETLLLLMLEQTMTDLGYDVHATASSVEAGLKVINGARRFDVAVLDVNLAGDQSFPIARRLRQRGVPVVFVSGYGKRGIPAEFADCPVIQKPYTEDMLGRVLETVSAN